MVFSSLTFVCVFLPLVVAFYFALPRQANNLVLVIASYLFYGWGDPVALLLIVPSVVMNFYFGRFIDVATGLRRRQFVTAAIAINLVVLIVFKYSDFILENSQRAVRVGHRMAGAIAKTRTTAWDLVLHLPYHFLSGGRLSRRTRGATIDPRFHSLYH